jgi:hypothetical protein
MSTKREILQSRFESGQFDPLHNYRERGEGSNRCLLCRASGERRCGKSGRIVYPLRLCKRLHLRGL